MISHSSTQRFNNCPYAYHLHDQGIHKLAVGVESNKAIWGKAGHAALAARYSGQSLDQCREVWLKEYEHDLDPQDNIWCREGAVRTLEAYWNYYESIDQQWEPLGVEVADNPDKPTLIIDLIAKHKQSGSIYFWDHKFKTKADWGAGRRYAMDAQITRYTAYVQEQYGDCAGCVMNMVVPNFRLRAYKGDPPGWVFKFERLLVSRSPEQIKYWQDSQRDWEQTIEHCKANNLYPKHLGYSCSMCEYYELCFASGDPEIRDALYGTEIPTVKAPFVVIDETE